MSADALAKKSRLLRKVERAARAMLSELGQATCALSVRLCADDEMARLNARYRGKQGPTDVLAFALRESEGAYLAYETLGDVVISVERAAAQAVEQGHSLEHEVYVLLAHGLLHLLGWDHDTETEDRRMRRKVTALVSALPSSQFEHDGIKGRRPR